MKLQQSTKIITSIFILIFSFNSVFPHSCITFKNLDDKEHAQKLDQVSAIFLGEVISSQEVEMYVYIIELQVLRSWKGVKTTRVKIKYTDPCSYAIHGTFQKGARWMIYGYSIKDSELIDINCCNFGLFDDERMKKIYGEGKVIEQPQPSISPTPIEQTESFWSNLWKKIISFFS